MPRTAHHRSTVHQTLRNPWLEGPGGVPGPGPGHSRGIIHGLTPRSHSGSPSSGSTTYEGYIPVDDPYAPEPPSSWRHQRFAPTAPVYDVPEAGVRGAAAAVPMGTQITTLPRQGGPGHGTRHSYAERPLTPGALSHVSAAAAAAAAVGGAGAAGCGGGCCDTLDTWCYYCVQVVLGVAALAGLSLLIAAAVLRGQPPRAAATANLSALPYIGAMLAAVSSALLLVQKCARNEKKRKKRRNQQLHRTSASGGGGTARQTGGGDMIPLQELQKTDAPASLPAPLPCGPPQLTHQFQPLLARPGGVLLQSHTRSREIPLAPNGIPWWRRQPAHPGRMVYPS